MMQKTVACRIAQTLQIKESQAQAAIALLDEGATVPFIARYRKEATNGLDDSQLRQLAELLIYLRELDLRRETILHSIQEQEKLTPELEAKIWAVENKTQLEDLYLPYKPKRRTKAQIAREAGLDKLAQTLLGNPNLSPEQTAESYLNPEKGIADTKAALDGARAILIESYAESAELIGQLRERLRKEAELQSRVIAGKEQDGAKFSDYFAASESYLKIPSHRALALFRGRNEGILTLTLQYQAEDATKARSVYEEMIAAHFQIQDAGRAADQWLMDSVRLAWKVKIFLSLELELLSELKEKADKSAIEVFAKNLNDLLLAAPAGAKTTMGLDPGIRTGVKVAVVDQTGKVLATHTIYPHAPKHDWQGAIDTLAKLIQQHKVELVAIGNGTASRETDKLAEDLKHQYKQTFNKVVVSEAGASVYSASELAAKEFPELDVSLRGAISIARRLQDPLAELVKIDPKSIGVGQYQHDVNQNQLARSLDAVVEDCVNAVGVDVNMASAPLLARISGLNTTLAQNIVRYRDENGPFKTRQALLKVNRLGEKTFEQAAGFLRINQGEQPLDASSVHPEAYSIVENILQKTEKSLNDLMGNGTLLKLLKPTDYTNSQFGLPTVIDIIKELEKPGRDPRPEFKTATFKEGVTEIKDLQIDMILEGVVTNVTNFGAFVDIGVHQDGLVHISALTDRFIDDPHKVVKAGQIVKVKVVEVDAPRKRIALTMRLNDNTPSSNQSRPTNTKKNERQRPSSEPQSAMAAAFSKLNKK